MKSITAQWRTTTGLGSSPSRTPAVGMALLDAAAVAEQAVEAAGVNVGAKLGRLTDHGFPRAEHQPAVLRHRRHQPVEGDRLLLGAEIEQDVAAQHDVEPAGMGGRLEQVVDLEADRLAQRFDGSPAIGRFLEPFDHLVDAEAALDLEMAIAAGPGASDARCGNVGSEHVDGPALPL